MGESPETQRFLGQARFERDDCFQTASLLLHPLLPARGGNATGVLITDESHGSYRARDACRKPVLFLGGGRDLWSRAEGMPANYVCSSRVYAKPVRPFSPVSRFRKRSRRVLAAAGCGSQCAVDINATGQHVNGVAAPPSSRTRSAGASGKEESVGRSSRAREQRVRSLSQPCWCILLT